MKNYIIISLFFTFFSCSSSKKINNSLVKGTFNNNKSYIPLKEYSGDTISFVKHNFIVKKDNYIGKEFSLFLKYFNVPIERYYSSIEYPPFSFYSNISIQIYNDVTVENKIKNKINPIILTITWETPIQTAEMDKLRLITRNNWTSEAASFFSKQKVKNIEIVDYGF